LCPLAGTSFVGVLKVPAVVPLIVLLDVVLIEVVELIPFAKEENHVDYALMTHFAILRALVLQIGLRSRCNLFLVQQQHQHDKTLSVLPDPKFLIPENSNQV